MKNDKSERMGSIKEYIEGLEVQYGGLRAAGRALGIDYQRLQYYKKSGHKLQRFLDFIEEARKKSKISKSAAWDALVKKD